MANPGPDQFFDGEPLEPDDAAFLGGEPGEIVPGDDTEGSQRKKGASWKIVVGIVGAVFLGVVGLNLYRGMTRPAANDFALQDAKSQAMTLAPASSPSSGAISQRAPEPTPTGLQSGAQADLANAAATAPAVASAMAQPNAVATASPSAPASVAAAAQATARSTAPATALPTAQPKAYAMAGAPDSPVPGAATSSDIGDLLKRVSDLEAAVATIRAPRASLSKVSKPTSEPRPRLAITPRKVVAATTGDAGSAKPPLASLRLRNITEGQAWIEDASGHTTVVGVGDSIEGAKVVRIVPDAFRVDTDRGPVTFASTRQ